MLDAENSVLMCGTATDEKWSVAIVYLFPSLLICQRICICRLHKLSSLLMSELIWSLIKVKYY